MAKEIYGASHDQPTETAMAILSQTGAGGVDTDMLAPPTKAMSSEEQERIKKAIREAKTLDEVRRLEALLRSGRLPQTAVQQDVDMQ